MAYRVLLGALICVALGYAVASRFIPMDAWTAAETVNASTLPTIYGILLAMVLLILLLRGADSTTFPGGYRILRLAGLCAAVLCFALAIGLINFWVALGALLLGSAWWLGERRWLPLIGLSAVPVVGFIGIELVLGVYLPGSSRT